MDLIQVPLFEGIHKDYNSTAEIIGHDCCKGHFCRNKFESLEFTTNFKIQIFKIGKISFNITNVRNFAILVLNFKVVNSMRGTNQG